MLALLRSSSTGCRRLREVVNCDVANRRGASGQEADAEQALGYLVGYASGVPMHHSRLVDIDQKHVTFKYKDYREGGKQKLERLPDVEFLGRFLSHVLPATHFRYIRHYGFLAPNKRGEKLPLIRRLLGMPSLEELEQQKNDDPHDGNEDWEEHLRTCKKCREGRLVPGPEVPRPRVSDIMNLPLFVSRHGKLPGPPGLSSSPVAPQPETPPVPLQQSLPLELIPLPWEYT